MSWEPLTKSLGSVLSERLASPLVGSFVISWLIINWKVVMILLSKTSVVSSITMIESLYSTPLRFYGLLFAAPFASAMLYLFALPFLSRPVTKWWLKKRKELDDDKKSVDETVLLGLPESRAIQQENYNLRNESDALKNERNDALDSAKKAKRAAEQAEQSRAQAAKAQETADERLSVARTALNEAISAQDDMRAALAGSEAARQDLLSVFNITPDKWHDAVGATTMRYDPLLVYVYIALCSRMDELFSVLTFPQMLILREFNNDGSMTFEQIVERTGLRSDVAKPAIDALLATEHISQFQVRVRHYVQFQGTSKGTVAAQEVRKLELKVRGS